MTWFSGFEHACTPDAPLRAHTWYGLGGPARWLCTPCNEDELVALLGRCREHGIPWRVLGRGANIIVRDEGFDGAVFKLEAPAFTEVRFDGRRVHAGAGADFPKLSKATLERGLLGFEALAGIPGTVGGLVRMNAGGRYGEIGPLVESLRLIDANGHFVTHPAAEIDFAYRRTSLTDCVILNVTFALQPGEPAAALKLYQEIWTAKHATQPPVGQRSAGCVFKNPPGLVAGALLEHAGMKGQRCGGAEISSKHANFVLAGADATARDVLDLIERAKERVRATAGIELELEAEIW